MNGHLLAEALTRLQDAFPRQPFGDRAVKVYAEQLMDLDGQDVLDAVNRLLRTSSWQPTIAEIRMEVAEGTDPLPTVEQAWDQAQAGHTRCPEVRESVEAVGGFWEILHGQNMATTRAHFRKDYEARRAREMKGRAGGEPIRAAQLKSAAPVSLNGHRLKGLPQSTRIRPRPVTRLMALRYAGHPSDLPPSTEERHDAILILAEGPTTENPADDPLYREAEDVFRRAAEIS